MAQGNQDTVCNAKPACGSDSRPFGYGSSTVNSDSRTVGYGSSAVDSDSRTVG